MNRRTFIKTSSLASSYLLVPGFLKPLERLQDNSPPRNLVVIQLSGGNDWLNTIVPFKNDVYYQKRSKIALRDDKLIALDKDMAMNSALSSLKEFYDSGEMAIVNSVGYPNPNRSHFRSTDIWQTASDSREILHTGWLGRYLDSECSHSYEAIEADNYLSLALKGKRLSGLAVNNIRNLHSEIKTPYFNDIAAAGTATMLSEDNQGYLYKTLIQTQSGVDYIYEKNKIFTNSYTYPDNSLSKQLKQIAGFIGSGLATRVYYVSMSGFDTHVGQNERQTSLLKQYAEAVSAFIKNLKELNKWDDSLVFTFSEFGRRVEENASNGTDHGTAGNVLMFAKNLQMKGIVNAAPNLTDLEEGDLRYSIDFRSIYRNILESWLQADANKIINARVTPFRVI